MNKFEKMFNPCGLRLPEKLRQKQAFGFPLRGKVDLPKELILSGYCTPVEDQGSKPYCAAYSASSFAENILWRKNGYRQEIDPDQLYAYAKTIDGDPTGDGTYLECTLEALLEKKYFDRSVCKVKTFGSQFFGLGTGDGLNLVKLAVHRYGVCIAGFQITSEWFAPKNAVITGKVKTAEGGHAVTICGYDEDGVVILNSWGTSYAHDGFVYITNKAFGEQFMYAACLTNALDNLK